MTDKRPGGRVTYVTWNLVATGVFGALALGDIIPALVDSPRSLALWAISAAVTAALGWAVWERHRRPTWLLPRLYLLSAVPVGLSLLVTNAMTAFWIGAIWLVIIPVILSGDWLDRWLGAPAQSSATRHP
ncbi:hypothetical protein [Corynebacterium faecale]|uniref:hypothetical protein n=1 Tax=Corynebacterium faecale TaxID=1758466 RepID=UPI0025B6187D|nr:hypothetical protein [Corynebacterium faecale]